GRAPAGHSLRALVAPHPSMTHAPLWVLRQPGPQPSAALATPDNARLLANRTATKRFLMFPPWVGPRPDRTVEKRDGTWPRIRNFPEPQIALLREPGADSICGMRVMARGDRSVTGRKCRRRADDVVDLERLVDLSEPFGPVGGAPAAP